MLAYKDGPRVRLISRNAVDHTARFRELAAAIAKLRADVLVLDGEIAVFDKELVSRFHLLGDNDDSGILCTPPIYIGFDVLQVGRRDLRECPRPMSPAAGRRREGLGDRGRARDTAEDTLDKVSARSLAVVGEVVREALPAIEQALIRGAGGKKP